MTLNGALGTATAAAVTATRRAAPRLRTAFHGALVDQALTNIEVHLHCAQPFAPVGLEAQHIALHVACKSEPLQLTRPRLECIGHVRVAVGRRQIGDAHASIGFDLAGDHAVQTCRAMRARLAIERAAFVIAGADSEPVGSDVARRFTKSVLHELTRNDQIATVPRLPAKDDVGMGIVGVPMVYRHPFKARPEGGFSPLHHLTRVGIEVAERRPVFGREDDAEMPTIGFGPRCCLAGAAVAVRLKKMLVSNSPPRAR